MSNAVKSKQLVKFYVSQDKHDLIRVAAALNRTSMADYARQIVTADAKTTSTRLLPVRGELNGGFSREIEIPLSDGIQK